MTATPRPLDETHDPRLRSWVDTANAPEGDFPIQNLPFGVFRRRGSDAGPRLGVAIGDQILDLGRCRDRRLLEGLSRTLCDAVDVPVLNTLMAIGPPAMSQLRKRLVTILGSEGHGADTSLLVPMNEAELHVPVMIREYTDFYASMHHATNVGRMFRPDNPLFANYKYVPIAYHGRSSSIVVGGTPIRRPSGQVKRPASAEPTFQRSERLDYEVEIGAFIGPGNALGQPVAIADAERHLFGVCLLNDWSARDLQAWESQPLGPFLAKNFATTISPWLVTFEALAPFRIPAFERPPGDPRPMPYLQSPGNREAGGVDIVIQAFLQSKQMRDEQREPLRLSTNRFRDMYWTPAQMLTHHASNGCNLRTGDLLGSGTVSGPHDDELGSLLELTRQGTMPFALPTGETRTFLEDGDEVIFRGYCARDGYARIGLGECRGIVVPAQNIDSHKRAPGFRLWAIGFSSSQCPRPKAQSLEPLLPLMNTWKSEAYLQHAQFVPNLGAAVLELMAPRKGERILDVGCGEGTLTQQIAERGATVVGIDSSQDMIDAARARGLDARLISAEALTFENEFDAVFSNAALHWIRNQDALLDGVAGALRRGGRFVAEFGGHGNVAAIEAAIEVALARRTLQPQPRRYYPTDEEYRARLTAHGFIVQQISLIPRPTPLPTGVRGWLGIFERSTLDRLGADSESAVDEIEELLRPVLCDASGRWTADYVRLRFSATNT